MASETDRHASLDSSFVQFHVIEQSLVFLSGRANIFVIGGVSYEG